jgi:hypothetical protein
MSQFKAINGWTKVAILKVIQLTFTKKSTHSGTNECMYRSDTGSKCAVGMFIPDETYRSEMDVNGAYASGTDVESLLEAFPQLSQFMPLELEALKLIQAKHDGKVAQYGIAESRSDAQVKTDLIQWVEANVSE